MADKEDIQQDPTGATEEDGGSKGKGEGKSEDRLIQPGTGKQSINTGGKRIEVEREDSPKSSGSSQISPPETSSESIPRPQQSEESPRTPDDTEEPQGHSPHGPESDPETAKKGPSQAAGLKPTERTTPEGKKVAGSQPSGAPGQPDQQALAPGTTDDPTETGPEVPQPEDQTEQPEEKPDESGPKEPGESQPTEENPDQTEQPSPEDGTQPQADDKEKLPSYRDIAHGNDYDPTNKDRKEGPLRAQDLAQKYGDKAKNLGGKARDFAQKQGWDNAANMADRVSRGGDSLSRHGAESNERIKDGLDRFRNGPKGGAQGAEQSGQTAGQAAKTGQTAEQAGQAAKAGKAATGGAQAGQAAAKGAQAGQAAAQGAKAGVGAAKGLAGGVGGAIAAGADIAAEQAKKRGWIKNERQMEAVRYAVAVLNLVAIVIEIILLFVPGVDIIDIIFLICNLIFFAYYVIKHKLWGFCCLGCGVLLFSSLPAIIGLVVLISPLIILGMMGGGGGETGTDPYGGINAPTSINDVLNPALFGNPLGSDNKNNVPTVNAVPSHGVNTPGWTGGGGTMPSSDYGTDDGFPDSTGGDTRNVSNSCSGVVKVEQDENLRFVMRTSTPYWQPDAADTIPQIATDVRSALRTQLYISSGFRSPQESTRLNRLYGSKANAGGCSWHNSGLAFDVPKSKYNSAQLNRIRTIAISHGWEPFNESDCIHFTYKPGGNRMYPSAPAATYAVCGYRTSSNSCLRA